MVVFESIKSILIKRTIEKIKFKNSGVERNNEVEESKEFQ